MKPAKVARMLRAACLLALAALGLMVWSLFDPRPVPVIAAMSVGQVLGALSFAAFLYVLVDDVRRRVSARTDAGDERVE
ncbi:MAG TPA: hypothetical protein VGL81_24290 [Polyangiaceae bacterium]|jgi:hypothetical protein